MELSFNPQSIASLLAVLLAAGLTFWTLYLVKRGKTYHLRQIAGLKAIDEAIGRATEMGRPILFTPGYGGDIQRPTTIASMSFLSSVAEKTAQYDCRLIYPTHDPIIMATAQDIVSQQYTIAGHPERYRPEDIHYLSSSQFAYAAGVEGEIVRERPASVFLLGTFEAEALIMAETAASVGAIQIAGTDSTIQLSFFIIACDYTLIGEELFAASGYLSGNPGALASIWAQDLMRIGCVLFIVLGVVSVLLFPDSQWWKF